MLLSVASLAPRVGGSTGAERGLIVGASGSGKSTLALALLRSYPRNVKLVLIDPNETFARDWQAVEPGDDLQPIEDPDRLRFPKSGPMLIHPDRWDAEEWDAAWEWLYRAPGPLMVYVDETMAMSALMAKRGSWLEQYLTRGRAHQRGALLASQRPRNIPLQILGNTNKIYMFRLPVPEDRAYIAAAMGGTDAAGTDIRKRAAPRYRWYYYSEAADEPPTLMGLHQPTRRALQRTGRADAEIETQEA